MQDQLSPSHLLHISLLVKRLFKDCRFLEASQTSEY